MSPLHMRRAPLLLLLGLHLAWKTAADQFYTAALSLSPCASAAKCDWATTVKLQPPLQLAFTFRVDAVIRAADTLSVTLPRFYGGAASAGATAALNVSPSLTWSALWTEGTYADANPYAGSRVVFTYRAGGSDLAANTTVSLRLEKDNGIKVYCGFEKNWGDITVAAVLATTIADIQATAFTSVPQVGDDCPNHCSGHGTCNYCRNTCACYEGFGNLATDTLEGGAASADCSQMTCPRGRPWFDATLIHGSALAVSKDAVGAVAHADQECSGNGTCDRGTGVCMCNAPFTGDACQRRRCPNDCSGHGRCLSMADLTEEGAAEPLTRAANAYGTDDVKAWDAQLTFGCLCDSSWPVGLGSGETQVAEYFGPHCGLIRCPSGDDPETTVNEENCEGKKPPGGPEAGAAGNKCHVDCANRGVCDYSRGVCSCFTGYYGDNCAKRDVQAPGGQAGNWIKKVSKKKRNM